MSKLTNFDNRCTAGYDLRHDDDSSTPRHPIRVVAHRTGLTPATIRAWERRYHAVEPARSEGGQRLYSDRDIDRLNTLRALSDLGRSIGIGGVAPPGGGRGPAVRRPGDDARPGPVRTQSWEEEVWVDDAFRDLTEMETESLERTLWRAFLSLGARRFLVGVAAPLLEKVGAAWAAGRVSPAQEHLGSGVLERVLSWMNDPSMSAQEGPGVVVATLPGERHALGARLAAAAATLEGWRPTYLGADLPVDEIVAAARNVGAEMVAISAVRTDQLAETEAALVALRKLLDADVPIVVGGAAAGLLRPERLPRGIQVLEDLGGFAEFRRDGAGS